MLFMVVEVLPASSPEQIHSIWLDPGPPEEIQEEATVYNTFQLVVLMEKTCCELPGSRDDLQTKSQFMVFVPISF